MILNKVLPDVIKDWQDDLPITGIIVISLISISDIPVRRISQQDIGLVSSLPSQELGT
ncbi:Uncharacterised protein [Bacteroides thetaiotaomicron]|nr:Uncharacterised protein [Bacteroides thetaiotaomicron]SPU30916.1 Uncharacterised protein [Bacteroides thetaiotaomicron]